MNQVNVNEFSIYIVSIYIQLIRIENELLKYTCTCINITVISFYMLNNDFKITGSKVGNSVKKRKK